MKTPKDALKKSSEDVITPKDFTSKGYQLLVTVEACFWFFFGYMLIYGSKELDSYEKLPTEEKPAIEWIFIWDFLLPAVVLLFPRFSFENFNNMHAAGGRYFYIMRLISTSVRKM